MPPAAVLAPVPPARGRGPAGFVVVGALTTAAYALLFLVAEPLVGAQLASAGALLLAADANTLANAAAGVLHFVLLERWAFRPAHPAAAA